MRKSTIPLAESAECGLHDLKAFEGKSLANSRDHNSVVCCGYCAVNHNNVVAINTGSGHGVATYPHKITGRRVRHHQIIDVKTPALRSRSREKENRRG